MIAVARDAREVLPHRVPVAIVAPAVVSTSLTGQLAEESGGAFVAVPATDGAAARRDLRRGAVHAVVEVDLATTRDTLLLDAAADGRLNDAIAERVAAIERSRGRAATVATVGAGSVTTADLRLVALGCGLAGFVLVVVIAWWRGALARTLALGALRLGALTLLSAAAGAGLAVVVGHGPREGPHGGVGLAAVAALAVLVAGATTLALGALGGFLGIGLAAAVYLGMAMPLATGTDPALLARPWQLMSRWTPPGTTLDALRALALYDGHGLRRAVLVLAVWLAAAVAAIVLARRERLRGLSGSWLRAPVTGTGTDRPARLRVAVAVLPAGALAVGLASFVADDGLSSVAAPASRASRTECVATGDVASVGDLNRIAATLRGGQEFQGADVGADVLLQDGRRLWLFGDTLRGAAAAGPRLVRNSMLVFGPGCIQNVLAAGHGALIPDRPRSSVGSGQDAADAAPVGYWPMSVTAVRRPGYDVVTVMTQRVRSTGTGGFDFEILGPAVAVFAVGRGQTPQLVTLRDLGPDSTDPARPVWGAASTVAGDWLYLYGTAAAGDHALGRSLRVARVRPERVVDPGAWRFWTGTRWSRSRGDAAELIGAAGGTSQTLSVFENEGRWFALSKRNDFLGQAITVWTAPHPWGPFDAGRSVAPLPSDAATGELRYMPLAHPGLLPRPGTVVVSYSRNRTDLEQVLDDPFLYRPRFLRIRLPG